MGNLTDKVEIRVVNAPIANASNTDDNSDRIDMQGWDGVVFITPVTDSAITGVAKLQVEQNTADQDAGMAALSGASATVTSAANDDLNDKALVVDVYRPRERYVQGVLTSTVANIAFGNTIAILYSGIKMPPAVHATILALTKKVSPAEA
jgi:hypothetical protein